MWDAIGLLELMIRNNCDGSLIGFAAYYVRRNLAPTPVCCSRYTCMSRWREALAFPRQHGIGCHGPTVADE